MTITLIDEARYDAEMDATVLPALQACMTEGWMEPATVDWEGKALPKLERPGRLHYYRYDARTFDALREEGASGVFRGTVVISHGFTEFGRKYSEMVWYFLLAGYSVCVFEHRGHGHSAHDMSNPSLVWIDDWRRYVADFATFAQTVGREAADGGPMYLYCHSMGGGIGAAVLERYPSLFDKAVLSAPMIAPVVGMPTWIARIVVGVICGLGFGKSRVFGHTDFDGNLNLDDYEGASEARIRWFHKQRLADVTCQTNAATFDWATRRWRFPEPCSNPTCVELSKLRYCYSKPDATCGCSTDHKMTSSNVCEKAAVPSKKCDTASHCTKFSPCRMPCSDHILAKSSIFCQRRTQAWRNKSVLHN